MDCYNCGKKFTSQKRLQNHVNIFCCDNLLCKNCNKQFISKKGFHYHFQKCFNVKEKYEKYCCQYCYKIYSNIYNVKRHQEICKTKTSQGKTTYSSI